MKLIIIIISGFFFLTSNNMEYTRKDLHDDMERLEQCTSSDCDEIARQQCKSKSIFSYSKCFKAKKIECQLNCLRTLTDKLLIIAESKQKPNK